MPLARGKVTRPPMLNLNFESIDSTQARACSNTLSHSPLTIAQLQTRFTPTMKAFLGTLILAVFCITASAQSGQSPLAPPKLPAPSASRSLLKVGAKAPDFALPNGDGKLVILSEYTPRSPVVLVFYRGFW